ncbi:MAG: HNH endonuclease [Candidatus Kapaibacterium sp.]
MNKYQRIPYREVELSKKNIFRRDSERCQYCGTNKGLLTIDHIIPKSRGGASTWSNLTTACFECNNKKSNMTPEEANMSLISKPHKPNYVLYLNQKIGRIEKEWKPFLFT